MRARFSQQQPPFKIVKKGETAYIYICINETQGQDVYQNIEDGKIIDSYYEYDYNEIIALESELPVEDIQAHPGNYINYRVPKKKTTEERLAELEFFLESVNNALLN